MDPDDILIELLSDPQTEDPYPLYQSLRETAPNHPNMLAVRFVSSHAGCSELMRSHDITTGFGLAGGGFEGRPFIRKTRRSSSSPTANSTPGSAGWWG